jgi:hypothetical protein
MLNKTMKIYHLIFDGSYVDPTDTLGLGIVHYRDGKVVFVDSIRLEGELITDKKSLFAEAMAACAALDYADKNSKIYIYGDNIDVIKIFRGDTPHTTESNIANLLKSSMGRHASITAKHISETDYSVIPEAIFALAHNASAVASGSKKRENTYPYKGPYSHITSNTPKRTDFSDVSLGTTGMEVIDLGKEDFPSWDPRSPKFKL